MILVDVFLSELSMSRLLLGGATLLYVVNFYSSYRRAVKPLRHPPDIYLAFPPNSLMTFLVPHRPGIFWGKDWAEREKNRLFSDKERDVITVMGLFPFPSVEFVVSAPVALKEITMNRSRFPKPTDVYKYLAVYGENVLSTEGDEWKLHRKVTAPAFSEKNNRLVWDETVRISLELFESWGTQSQGVVIDDATEVTTMVALATLCSAAFGRRIALDDGEELPSGHELAFKDAVAIVAKYLRIKIATPNWAYSFSKFLRRVKVAYDELEVYMREMQEDRRSSAVKSERHDLFSALLDAAEEEGGAKFSSKDVIGNIFIFLIAGQETTAHTMSFCLGLLALEQDTQERLFQHVSALLENGEVPAYEQMYSYNYVLAIFNETLRLFPPVTVVPKICAEDTTVSAHRLDGSKDSVLIPAGSRVNLNAAGLHDNPRFWPDPEAFKPERFLGDWRRDAFLPFSAGSRACLGRKFSETEFVAFLVMFILRYKVELRDPEQYENLTHAQARAKLLANKPAITVTPVCVPLIFKRR